jgi:hypothetical protein
MKLKKKLQIKKQIKKPESIYQIHDLSYKIRINL